MPITTEDFERWKQEAAELADLNIEGLRGINQDQARTIKRLVAEKQDQARTIKRLVAEKQDPGPKVGNEA